MKSNSALKDLTLIQIIERFDTDELARLHLESVLWPHGAVCPHCRCNDQSQIAARKANPEKKIRAGSSINMSPLNSSSLPNLRSSRH